MASSDKYCSYLDGEEDKNTQWRFGVAPKYEVVNKLFEEERTKVWPPGSSLEEMVQNLVKTWQMELIHKTSIKDYKSIHPKFTYSLNGRKPQNLEELEKLGGGYNPDLQTSLPEKFRIYNPDEETDKSSHIMFTTTLPRGFALEVLQVYTGPPLVVFKFRHWGYMEGPFKGHAPTGELIQLFGITIMELDENNKLVKLEFFYDRGELLGRLVKGPTLGIDAGNEAAASSCPVLRNTG